MFKTFKNKLVIVQQSTINANTKWITFSTHQPASYGNIIELSVINMYIIIKRLVHNMVRPSSAQSGWQCNPVVLNVWNRCGSRFVPLKRARFCGVILNLSISSNLWTIWDFIAEAGKQEILRRLWVRIKYSPSHCSSHCWARVSSKESV